MTRDPLHVIQSGRASRSITSKHLALHVARVGLFAGIILLINSQHRFAQLRNSASAKAIPLAKTQRFFPEGQHTRAAKAGVWVVLDAKKKRLGHILQTSPESAHIVGFSGPTNVLIAFGNDDRIVGLEILSSGDTREHLAEVKGQSFLKSFVGKTWDGTARGHKVDAVSGATLTSLAIHESIIHRLGGAKPSLRFPEPLKLEGAQKVFPDAASMAQDRKHSLQWHVIDKQGAEIGTFVRTSPAADNIVGYQGPTDTWIGFNPNGQVIGLVLAASYDNREYVSYVRKDDHFLTLFNGMRLKELAELDVKEAEVEGVSGATMTSLAVADGLVKAATEFSESLQSPAARKNALPFKLRDVGTAVIIFIGMVIGLTSLRGNRLLRIVFLCCVIGYLGLINGDMVSQAMLAGWAKSGVPWRSASGLFMLTLAAFAVPLTSRNNIYCSHLCPHGAAQQLLRNRLPWRIHLPGNVAHLLSLLPPALLTLSVMVAMTSLTFSLVDIEPFDAWVFWIAGWATITVAVAGLAASLFLPMAYCRFGCPTGTLIGYLRFNSRSDRWCRRDWLALSITIFALGLRVIEIF